jgi:sugar-specific transcriptional regulator TrmB
MIEALQRAGLTKGEARVYLAITELGESTVGKIVDVSGVTKSIIYQILEKLIEKGLVSFSFKEKTKYFQAAPPDNLITYLEEQEETLNETKKEMRELIPQLLMKRATANSGQVTVYQGFKGLMTVYTKRFEKLKPGDEYVNIGLPPHTASSPSRLLAKRPQRKRKKKDKSKAPLQSTRH